MQHFIQMKHAHSVCHMMIQLHQLNHGVSVMQPSAPWTPHFPTRGANNAEIQVPADGVVIIQEVGWASGLQSLQLCDV